MDAQQIKRFIDAMAASDLCEMEVQHDGWSLRLVRQAGGTLRQAPAARTPADEGAPTPPARPAEAAAASDTDEVLAPVFGVVHLRQAPEAPPFVQLGDVIEAGGMLCSIEAMKVFNEVRAERGGRVAAIHVTSGSEVEAGQALFTLEQVPHV